MSEVTDLTVIEIKPEQAPVLYVAGGLDAYLDQIRQLSQEVPDVTTKKGRDRIGSLARAVGSSKKAIEDPGRAYLKHLKEAVKPAEEELRRFTRECDVIRDAILKPRDDWEAEQERLKQEEEARLAAEAYSLMRDEADSMNAAFDVAKTEALKKQIETDHEMALLMNDAFDRAAAEEAAEKERKRIEYEAELTRLAENAARRAVEVKAEQDRLEAAHREYVLKSQAEQAERDRIDAEQKAEADKKAAFERAEREKQEAIAAEQRKAQEEAARIKREADQREAARLAEEKRIADELEARQADVNHRKTVGTAIVNALTAHTSITREQAIEVLTVLKDDLIPRVEINY
ncbi:MULTISPECIES: hypothetical protein [Enterobacter]|uniref:hypothetical protein n=1 Tax=Enterobacter TaxID=547 RepID=UPI0015F44D23|nr:MULTISPECIES: hypothetical protein [Enterobacter]MBA7773636.1 hypothetical protein [Enterobacter sp. RHBSTW-00974]MBA7778799.1 hypothetical protein [Enterobacter sp. RHBSTW-00318]MBA7831402.1 hypothetical protein [Enterobacter sp. RHBSTW-00340]WGG63950.1 hypothetical protein QCL67_15450 [Enterobacter ludwigii]WGG66653.1 hypothetical protein QCL67_04590 [Enterobacter ludwigii]